jgi:hypothetical protein
MDGVVVIGEGEKDDAPMLFWHAHRTPIAPSALR